MASTVDRHVGKTKGPIRKKAKISELPITSAKRSTIDGMLRFFKKGGEFDALRKQIYAHFEEEVSHNILPRVWSPIDISIEHPRGVKGLPQDLCRSRN